MSTKESWSFPRGRMYPAIDNSTLPSHTGNSPAASASPVSNSHHVSQLPSYYVQSPSQLSTYSEKPSDVFATPYSSAPSSPLSKTLSYPAALEDRETLSTSCADSESESLLPMFGLKRPVQGYGPWKSGRGNRWKSRMDEESLILLPERDVPKSPEIEDFKFLCMRVAVMTSLLTVILLASLTLLYWVVCQPRQPLASFEGIKFKHFSVSPGNDRTGVPTQVAAVDSSVDISLYNPSKYHGTLVHPISVSLSYIRNLASSKVEEFYQPEDSTHMITVPLTSVQTPLYGAALPILAAVAKREHINLSLNIHVHSQVKMFNGLVHRHFNEYIKCDIVFDPSEGIAYETSCQSAQST